jgi:hypothetical protein
MEIEKLGLGVRKKEPLNSFRCNNNAKIANPKIFRLELPSLSEFNKSDGSISFR